MANSTPIHQPSALGAHQVEPPIEPGGCLRAQRERHV